MEEERERERASRKSGREWKRLEEGESRKSERVKQCRRE